MLPTPLVAVLFAAAIPLPGGPPVGMDYLAYDPATNRIWVPAGNTGNVDVVDAATGKVTAIGGFPTAPPRKPGRPRMGPSSATVGAGVVWVGNRGDNQLRAFDAKTLKPRGTVQLAAMPDGLAYVARTHELWVTIPSTQSIDVVQVGGPTPGAPTGIKLDGEPEGYAVDDARGLFYTNLEDKDQTLALDVKTRQVVGRWPSGCGAEGPRGLALDGARRLLFVACTDGAVAFDLAHDRKAVGRIKTGGGVDNLAYDPGRRLLFVASGKDGELTVAHVPDAGALDRVTTLPTAKGARNPIVDARGTVYVEDASGGALLVLGPDFHASRTKVGSPSNVTAVDSARPPMTATASGR
jgi:DNA-binding beta-propeller fold protein YncE